jgi:hypothetical protein
MNQFENETDRIAWSRRLLLAAALFTAACLALATVFGLAAGRSPLSSDRTLFRRLDLSSLSLIPSGSPGRNSEIGLPGVDLRFSPGLFRGGSDPAEILLPGNGQSPMGELP